MKITFVICDRLLFSYQLVMYWKPLLVDTSKSRNRTVFLRTSYIEKSSKVALRLSIRCYCVFLYAQASNVERHIHTLRVRVIQSHEKRRDRTKKRESYPKKVKNLTYRMSLVRSLSRTTCACCFIRNPKKHEAAHWAARWYTLYKKVAQNEFPLRTYTISSYMLPSIRCLRCNTFTT